MYSKGAVFIETAPFSFIITSMIENISHVNPLKIGVFDSGVGGLSVLRAIHELLPGLEILYFADQAHVPYGRRQMDEIRFFSKQITSFLLKKDISLLVVACNTASAAALKFLRQQFPDLPIVGMEPAVKPASELTHNRAVGVLATPATFQGELYQSLVHKYGDNLKIYQDTCPGLVEQIEAGNFSGEETRKILEYALTPMIEKKVDMIVLGCTHYPFVLDEIRTIIGKNIQVIDPSPAIARRVKSLLEQRFGKQPETLSPTSLSFFTSGNPVVFQERLKILIGVNATVDGVTWQDDTIQSL